MTAPSEDQKKTSISQTIFNASPFIGAFSLSQLTSYPNNYLLVIIPFLAVEGILMVFFLNKVNKKKQAATNKLDTKTPASPASPPKHKTIFVEKYEITDNVLKFSVKRGLFKKRWVVLKQIPVLDIAAIELSDNELSVTTQEGTGWFVLQKNGASFSGLPEQILGLLEEHRKTLEFNEKAAQRKSDLAALLAYSAGIVDVSFDMLMGLQFKPVNWEKMGIYINSLKEKTEFAAKSLAPLTLDYSKVAAAIRTELPPAASKETFNVLKTVFAYFGELSAEEDLSGVHPNFNDAKTAISAYYTLNDLLLGRIVGEENNQPEIAAFQAALQALGSETAFSVDFQNLTSNIEKVSLEVDSEDFIEQSRETLKEQLINLNRPNEHPIAAEPPSEPATIEPEPALPVPQETPLPQTPEPTPLPEPSEPPSPPTIEPPIEPPTILEPPAVAPETEPEPKTEDPNSSPAPLEITEEKTIEPSVQEPELSVAAQQETSPAITEQTQAKEEISAATVEPPLAVQEPKLDMPLTEEPKPAVDAPKKKSWSQRLRKSVMGY